MDGESLKASFFGGSAVNRVTGLFVVATMVFASSAVMGQNVAATPKAKKTLDLLEKKISVEFKDTRLEEIMEEFKDQVKGLSIQLDGKGGVSKNSKFSFAGKDVPVKAVLEGLLKSQGKGFVIISNTKDAYDGSVYIKVCNDFGKLVDKK